MREASTKIQVIVKYSDLLRHRTRVMRRGILTHRPKCGHVLPITRLQHPKQKHPILSEPRFNHGQVDEIHVIFK